VEKEYPHKQRQGSRAAPRKKQKSLETELREEEKKRKKLRGEGQEQERWRERRSGGREEEKDNTEGEERWMQSLRILLRSGTAPSTTYLC